MSGREIVTLQIGHFANFVGSHWWNIQESSFVYQECGKPTEVSHDVLFREGQTLHGDLTYTPRLVAVDLRDSLKTLRREGILYEYGQEEEVKWGADVTLHESSPIEKNDYLEDLDKVEAELIDDRMDEPSKDTEEITEEKDKVDPDVQRRKLYNLDDSVSVWSDYLRVHLHPRTVHIVQDYSHKNEEHPFDVFTQGAQVLKNVDEMESIENRIRYFVEECDYLQGFQCLSDWWNGFGGYGSSLLEYLQDEFSRSCLTFGLSPAVLPDSTPRERVNRIINCALSLNKTCNFSTLFVPMSLSDSMWKKMGPNRIYPFLNYKADVDYHTSSILAATMDTLTLPYRKKNSCAQLTDITKSFSAGGRKVASVGSSFPLPIHVGSTFEDTLMKSDVPMISLTPHVMSSGHSPYMQSCVLRGIPSDLPSSRSTPVTKMYGSCSTSEEILQLYLTETAPQSFNAGCALNDPCKVVAPFPHIFSSRVSRTGIIMDTERPPSEGVESVPVMTALQSSGALHNFVHSLCQDAAHFDLKKHHRYLEGGLEEHDYQEALAELADLSECYKTDTSLL